MNRRLDKNKLFTLIQAYSLANRIVSVLAQEEMNAQWCSTLHVNTQSSSVDHPGDVIDAEWYEVKELPLLPQCGI